MSILTSIFIDSLPSAKKRCKNLALPLKGIEHVYDVGAILNNETLGTLLGIIRGGKKRDPFLADEIEFYDMRERVIFKVPDEIVQALAESTKNEIDSFTKSWKELDPSFGDVKKKYLKATLLSMQEASIIALRVNEPVLIFVST